MTCPACGQPVTPGEERCPSCRAIVAPPVEGALAAEPRLVTPPSRARAEPLRELPGTRRRERTWKDEVRDRVRDRRRHRDGDSELPLFREEGPLADLGPSEAKAETESLRSEAEPRGIRELGDETASRADIDDLPLRPREEAEELAGQMPAVEPSAGRATVDEESFEADRLSLDEVVAPSVVEQPPAPQRLLLDEPAEQASPKRRRLLEDEAAERDEAAHEDAVDGSWTLDPSPRPVGVAAVERPAGSFERLQAALLDLALLAALWTVVVYFASRAAHVPITGLVPSWPYLGGYLAFLGLTYAAYFTGATGQTLGKIVSGLRVVDTGGQPPGYLRAFVRAALGALGIVMLFGGLLPMFFDPARRAAHDRLLRTRVIKG
jgi:uncharacterized RDD family membrane protein YckC